MKIAIRETVEKLTAVDGPSGFEQPVVAALGSEFEALGARVTVDSMGNVYAELLGSRSRPHVMLAAHSDEVGAIVRAIDERGFLRIDGVGAVAAVLFAGRRVRIGGHLGVIGVKPVHVQSPEDRLKSPPIDQLYVDVGAASAAEVEEMGIRVGSPVAHESPLKPFTNENRLCGKAIDNRLGCAVLLQLFKELRDRKIDVPGQLTAVVAVQEEVGFRGATVAARRVAPDYAIVVDTVPVADTPDVPVGTIGGRIGAGPALIVAASAANVGHIGHPEVGAWLEAAAVSCNIPLQRITSIGYAVTDAAAVHLRGTGIPTAALGLPRRYSHSPVEVFDIRDAEAAVELLVQFAANLAERHEPRFLPAG